MVGVGEAPRDASVWHMYKVPIVLGSVSLLLIVISIYLLIKTYQASEPIQFETRIEKQATVSGAQGELLIDVSGAVKKPSVYRLPFGSRVDDAIIIAGGMTHDADMEKIALTINRAAKLSDGAKVYIPQKKDTSSVRGVTVELQGGEMYTATVSINAASIDDLERLNGVGPATSAKLLGEDHIHK